MLPRILILAMTLMLPLSAARIKLFLQGGGDMLVSEYSVEGDRVRYYSVERSDWEEIPLELVDLERTKQLHERQEAAREVRRKEVEAIRASERQARTELHRVPLEDGVYYLLADDILPVQQAEIIVNKSKTATLLRVFSPLPAADKETLEVAGPHAALVADGDRPMFFLRLEKINRIEIFRLKSKNKSREVQILQKIPKTQEIFETHETVEIFRQQLAPSVYKVWAVDPMPAGDYAVIEYTPGKENLRLWDFTIGVSAASAARSASASKATR